jgi:hypothetical protein
LTCTGLHTLGWRKRPSGNGSFALALLLLGACTASPPPTVPQPSVPPVVARPSPREARVRDATWQFRLGQGSCSATASERVAGFEVLSDSSNINFALRPSAVVRTTLRTRPAVNLSFTGPEGEWRIAAVRGSDGAITVQQPLDEVAAGRILALLGGGIAAAEGASVTLPQLRLPPSGSAGRAWFECVRRLLLQ